MQQNEPAFDIPKEGVSVTELKRVIEMLPLETSAVNAVAPRLAMLDPKQFAALLTELARDNHAFRCLFEKLARHQMPCPPLRIIPTEKRTGSH